jgi:hypothetical protein
MGGVGQDATLQAYHLGDPPPGPDLATAPRGLGATLQQGRQARPLLLGQSARSAGRWSMPKSPHTAVASTCQPLTDGAFADAQRVGDLALGPALLLKAPGLEPSGFSPMVGCRVHAWPSISSAVGTLAFYPRLSRFGGKLSPPFSENFSGDDFVPPKSFRGSVGRRIR